MIELKIVKKEGYNYSLIDKDNKEYDLNIEFYDIDNNPSVNDLIYINENLLKDDRVFSFGRLDGVYGRNILTELDEDILAIKINNDYIFLKRYYG